MKDNNFHSTQLKKSDRYQKQHTHSSQSAQFEILCHSSQPRKNNNNNLPPTGSIELFNNQSPQRLIAIQTYEQRSTNSQISDGQCHQPQCQIRKLTDRVQSLRYSLSTGQKMRTIIHTFMRETYQFNKDSLQSINSQNAEMVEEGPFEILSEYKENLLWKRAVEVRGRYHKGLNKLGNVSVKVFVIKKQAQIRASNKGQQQNDMPKDKFQYERLQSPCQFLYTKKQNKGQYDQMNDFLKAFNL